MGAAVSGAGLGLALTSLMNLIVTSVPASQTGVAYDGGAWFSWRTQAAAL